MYSEQQVAGLNREAARIPIRIRRMMLDMPYRDLRSELAREYFTQGFMRRMTTVGRCVQRVYELIPPDTVAVPEQDTRKDTEIAIQSFVFNVFGALDNLAWVWVSEAGISRENGQPLRRHEVGLHQRCRVVRESFSADFQRRLIEFDAWYEVLLNFRHALAHRIPLYIPPFCVDPDNAEDYGRLEEEKNAALLRVDVAEYERLEAAQMLLVHFMPFITYSITEDPGRIAFHGQLIADFNTVDDLRVRLMDEVNQRRDGEVA